MKLAPLAAVLLVGASAAKAEASELTMTAQAVFARGEFLTQAPAPPSQGVLCLVDSGVDVNPDTESIVLSRESVLGGTADDVTAYNHGTYVAMVAGASANGWGMVGAWPGLSVLSVRALPEGTDNLSGDAYRDGILSCRQAKRSRGLDVKVIELALGGPMEGRTPAELADLNEAIARARADEISVVSAAGNDGGPVNVPAALPGVLAVAAAARDGGLCAFSSRGAEVDVTALGCGMDVAQVPNGDAGIGESTSLASAYVAGVLTALRSFRPDLTAAQAEAALASSPGGRFDAAAAFRAAGLGSLVDAYVPPQPPPAPQPAACNAATAICVSPRVSRATKHGRRVTIRLATMPKGVKTLVRVDGRRRYEGRSKRIVLKVRRFKTISLRFVAKGRTPSAAVVLRPRQFR
ncbi:subtilase family protein [Solirubrobacter pauli]|uniref:Subtilase family protein n=1 Tax=Solirubrobacter pauli TaxID=166793 RepID=A0A660L710_9ACTN|nr:S8 family serine peptidase [Solirubrobacter pauli]RKQ90817.1 subtilase family protein [Solirubrobacter pauli]